MKTCCHIQGLTVELLKSRLKVCQADNARCCAENEQLRNTLERFDNGEPMAAKQKKAKHECLFCEDTRESLQATRINGVYAGIGAVPCPKCCKPEIAPQAVQSLLLAALDELISDYPDDCDRIGNVAKVAKRELVRLRDTLKERDAKIEQMTLENQ